MKGQSDAYTTYDCIFLMYTTDHDSEGQLRTKLCDEEFEDTKGVIKILISKKNRKRDGQKKKYKRTNNDLQNIHIKQNNRSSNTKNRG